MNEFEWRRQLRELQQPVAPRRNLWPAIETALELPAEPATGRNTHPRPAFHAPSWLLVASFAGITLLALGLGLHRRPSQAVQPSVAAVAPTPPGAWKPQDPRLAGAAIELDAARMELHQAIEQSPDSAALQRLLLRTAQQQSRLRQLDQAG